MREKGKANSISMGMYPLDWTKPAYRIIHKSSANKQYEWEDYDPESDKRALSLCATLEIPTATYLESSSLNANEQEVMNRENCQREAWKNALNFGELLWKDKPTQEFVVEFIPKDRNGKREVICIYQRLAPIMSITPYLPKREEETFGDMSIAEVISTIQRNGYSRDDTLAFLVIEVGLSPETANIRLEKYWDERKTKGAGK